MRPGTLSKQYKDPAGKRGAYYQLSFTHKVKSRRNISDLRLSMKRGNW